MKLNQLTEENRKGSPFFYHQENEKQVSIFTLFASQISNQLRGCSNVQAHSVVDLILKILFIERDKIIMTKYKDPITFVSENEIGIPSVVTLPNVGMGIITATTKAMQSLKLDCRVILCSQLISGDMEIIEKSDSNVYDYIIFDDFGNFYDDETPNEIIDYIKRYINKKHIIIVKAPENLVGYKDITFDFDTANYTWHLDKTTPYEYGYTKESK